MKNKTTLAALIQEFFTGRLIGQRRVSPHTIASYRDTFRLLLKFAQRQLKKEPAKLGLAEVDTPFLIAFLDYLEKERGNGARSRNARLAAIHSFFRYVALQEPEYAAQAQRILAIPCKRYTRRPIDYLTSAEVEALLQAPNQTTWAGRRDPLFPNMRGGKLSADGMQYLLEKHVAVATAQCSSLRNKRVTPHVLRHTAAMNLLHHGVDSTVIALWLGHEQVETTQMYLRASLDMKERTLDKINPYTSAKAGRFRPDDQLLEFLNNL